ncbi:GNAT family N-acetyltransferase [uncultured Desulfobacter sp.]|uniref:GNAT family N-acetyltransferase n=1 Tax=uncultured Desulfobacter sp. TaxID=240139 RepID=UPI002AAA7287|nr:GNAT family N-acetyltransferase [uncultured Desulfobacter sp.]
MAIQTNRLTLAPATVELARAEINNGFEFKRLLGASVPKNWPPEALTEALPLFLKLIEAAPDKVGWFNWYALAQADGQSPPILIGGCGFFGPPCNGAVQIGYSVLSEFQGQGFATEMVCGIVKWAMAQPTVVRIIAETEWENPASVRVLEKVGFTATGSSADMRGTRFELLAEN